MYDTIALQAELVLQPTTIQAITKQGVSTFDAELHFNNQNKQVRTKNETKCINRIINSSTTY